MSKICTDIPQSKKLIELGIDIKTADMYYKYVLPKSDRICHVPEIGSPINALKWYNKGYTMSGKELITLDEYCIPAWSLQELIELLPRYIEINGYVTYLDIFKTAYCGYVVEYSNQNDNVDFSFNNQNLIDSCYEMIVKLYEMN